MVSFPVRDVLTEEMSSWTEGASEADLISATEVTLDRERVIGVEDMQEVEHQGLDLMTEAILDSGRVLLEMGMMDGTEGRAFVEMMSFPAVAVMVRKRDMVQEVIMITGIHMVAMTDLLQNMSEVLTETMTVAGQVIVVRGKPWVVTERAMRVPGRTIAAMAERDMVATEEDLVVAKTLLEVEMTMPAEGRRNTEVAEVALVVIDLYLLVVERLLDVDVVSTMVGRSFLVVERVLVMAEGLVTAGHILTLRETDMLVPGKDLVGRKEPDLAGVEKIWVVVAEATLVVREKSMTGVD